MRWAMVLLVLMGTTGGAWPTVRAQRLVSCSLGANQLSADLPLPTLAPPPGVLPSGSPHRGASTASFTCSLRYTSPASPAELADHVAAQMATAGWKPGERKDDGALALRLFSGSSTAGAALTAEVTVTTLEGSRQKDVALHIVRREAPGDDRVAPPPPTGRSGGSGAAARGDAASTIVPTLRRLLYASPVAGPGESPVEQDAMPPAFPVELLPAGTTVRLAVTSPTRATVVGLAPSLSVFEITGHLAALSKTGWSGRPPMRGFTLNPSPFLRPVELCRATEAATVQFEPLPGGGHAVRASHVRDSKVPCDSRSSRTGAFHDVAIPILVPTGVRAARGSGGGGPDDTRSETRGETAVSREAIVKELAAQLAEGGWTINQQVSAGSVTVIRSGNTSATGDPVTALVTVTEITATRVALLLRVVRHKPVVPPRGGGPMPRAIRSPDRRGPLAGRE